MTYSVRPFGAPKKSTWAHPVWKTNEEDLFWDYVLALTDAMAADPSAPQVMWVRIEGRVTRMTLQQLRLMAKLKSA